MATSLTLTPTPVPSIALNTPDVEITSAVEAYAQSIVPRSRLDELALSTEMMVVDSDASKVEAERLCQEIASTNDIIEKRCWDPIVGASNRLHKALVAVAKPWRKMLSGDKEFKTDPSNLRAKLERKLFAYKKERDAAIAAEQKRLDDLAAEAKRRADEEARKLMQRGQVAEAKQLREDARAIPVPVIPTEIPKAGGISYPVTYSAEVTNLVDFLGGILQGIIPIEAIQPNQPFLNTKAREMRDEMNWPGVKLIKEDSMRARR
jgi:hypothetical protein